MRFIVKHMEGLAWLFVCPCKQAHFHMPSSIASSRMTLACSLVMFPATAVGAIEQIAARDTW